MKILCIDDDRPEVDFVWRCQSAGHSVRWFCQANDLKKDVGRGMVSRIADWHGSLNWADLIVLTSNTVYVQQLDAWRKRNPKACVIAATQASAEWELNRVTGMKVFKKHGIALPPYKEFSDYDAAIRYVKAREEPMVSKPCGDEPDKSLSYVGKSPSDLVFMLERWKKAGRHKGAFILQEKVSGVEMAVGAWFGPGGFNKGWCENWEFKKLMVGDLGVATGEQGTILRMVTKSKLADKVLKPLEDALAATGHTGYVDVNCIIDDKGGPWPLEFTTRFGYPTFNIQQELLEGDPAEWLERLSAGQDARPWLLNKIACGVVLSIPDYPYSHLTKKEVTGIPIYGLNSRNLPHIHPLEMMSGEAPQQVNGKVVTAPCLVTSGDYVLVASQKGETVQKAAQACYRVLDGLEVPNSPMWRTDIGRRLGKQLPELQRHGYATGMLYA